MCSFLPCMTSFSLHTAEQHSQVQAVLITVMWEQPASTHQRCFTTQSCWTNVSSDSSHLTPCHPSPLLDGSSSPTLSSRPGLCHPSFLSSAWLVDSKSRPGAPSPLPRGLKGAALELEAPRPSGSLTCPQREASEVRVALLGERTAGLEVWPRTGAPPVVRPGQTQPARHWLDLLKLMCHKLAEWSLLPLSLGGKVISAPFSLAHWLLLLPLFLWHAFSFSYIFLLSL